DALPILNTSKFPFGSLNYFWDLGDGKTLTDSNIFNYKYQTDSIYTVRLSASYNSRCRTYREHKVYLGGYPEAKFSINNPKQCFVNNSFDFINHSIISKGNIQSYEWNFGDATSSNNPDYLGKTYTSEDSFNVRLIVITDKACSDTMNAQVITFAQPRVNLDILDSQCWNQNPYLISNKTSIKNGTFTNIWDYGDGSYSYDYQSNQKHYPNKTEDYNIKYKAISEHGCIDSIVKQVTILERPHAAIEILDSIQCFNGHHFQFINSSTHSSLPSLGGFWEYANGDTSIGFEPINAEY